MTDVKIWDNQIPFFNSEINNAENDGINTLKIYPANTDKKAPMVVILPGGAYAFRSFDNEGENVAKFYNENGINAAVVNYRVAPYHYPACLLDVQRAIKIIRYNADKWNIDEDKIFILGFSAGGHLAGMVATKPDICNLYNDEIDKMSAKPNGAIICYAVCSADNDKWHEESFKNLIGDDYLARKEQFSNEKFITKETCPCFIWHCQGDSVVPVENSIDFATKLVKAGVSCELHVFPDGFHGIGLAKCVKGAESWPQLSIDWIKKNF